MSIDFRPTYRELSQEEKEAVDEIKTSAEDLSARIDSAQRLSQQVRGLALEDGRGPMGRYFSLARTNLEETVMWAVKGATGPHNPNTEEPA